MATGDLRFGLVGTGRIGQVHAATLAQLPGVTLARVADPVVAGAEAVAERYGAVAMDSPEALIDATDLDAVIIASPTPTHLGFIERCVDGGMPVLCEKPIDLDIARVDQLRAKVNSSSVPVALGFNQRFDPGFAEVKRRIVAGDIGVPEQVSIVSRDPGPPPGEYIAVSGGIFRDMTIHDFDMARFLLGDIVEVSAFGSQVFDAGAKAHGDFDSVSIMLRAASGALATIVNSRHSAIGYDQRLEVFGAHGVLQVANAPTSLVSVSTGGAVEAKNRYVDFFLERYADAYALEVVEFMKLVLGEPSRSPSYDDGRAALLIADAAQRSAETGETIRVEG